MNNLNVHFNISKVGCRLLAGISAPYSGQLNGFYGTERSAGVKWKKIHLKKLVASVAVIHRKRFESEEASW
jgi:hypothetical protein